MRGPAMAPLQLGMHGHLLTGRRDRNRAIGPVDQLSAQVRFELADRVAKSRLGDKAALRGTSEMLGLREGEEVLQLSESGYAFHRKNRIYQSD